MDTFNSEFVAYELSEYQDTKLVTDTLNKLNCISENTIFTQ